MNKHASVLCVVQRASRIYKVITLYTFIYVRFLKLLKPGGHYMYRQFNIKQFILSAHTVFMCFVWITEQTAIISLYNIN